MKKFLRLFVILSGLSILFFNTLTIQASSILEDTLGVTTSYAEDTEYSMLRGSHLNYGTVKITELSSNSISVHGFTQCHHVCDNVYLSIYLERKVNGSYATYKSWAYTSNDASNLSKTLVVSVPTGYYYRIRGYHAASDAGSSKESITTLTDGVYVG